MSRKLGAIALGMAILAGAMELKSVVTARSGAVLTANGPAPMPTYPTKRGVTQPTTVPSVR